MLWVTTPSGLKWSLMNPRPEDVDIQDIAQNLSLQVRFNGSAGAYTIAEHSVHIHDWAAQRAYPLEWRLFALLHDAHEAYLGDVVTPAVTALGAVLFEMGLTKKDNAAHEAMKVLKDRADAAIFTALGLPSKLPGSAYHAIKVLDAGAMMTERDALMPPQPEAWGSYETVNRLNFAPACWPAATAREKFMDRYFALKEQLQASSAA